MSEGLNEAIAKHAPPEIRNTDQGSRLTGSASVTTLTDAGVRISMNGWGRYLENIFIERLWRSQRPDAIYLEERSDGFQARRGIKNWMAFYYIAGPIPRLIGKRRTRHIGPAWTRRKQHET